jgi:hypothetical protein
VWPPWRSPPGTGSTAPAPPTTSTRSSTPTASRTCGSATRGTCPRSARSRARRARSRRSCAPGPCPRSRRCPAANDLVPQAGRTSSSGGTTRRRHRPPCAWPPAARSTCGPGPRSPPAAGHMITPEEQRALERAMSLTDSAGGYLVPFQLDPTVIITANGSRQPDPAGRPQVVATGDVWNGVSAGAVTWSWDGGGTEARTRPTFAQPSIPVYKADGFVPDLDRGAAGRRRTSPRGRQAARVRQGHLEAVGVHHRLRLRPADRHRHRADRHVAVGVTSHDADTFAVRRRLRTGHGAARPVPDERRRGWRTAASTT